MGLRRSTARMLSVTLLAAAALAGCASTAEIDDAGAQHDWGHDSVEALPDAGPLKDARLADVLAQRRSGREFTAEPLSREDIAALLWSAQGITAEWGGRTAPSAGALYPLEIYVVTANGIQHYLPPGHQVQVRQSTEAHRDVAAAIGQGTAESAAAIVVIAAVPQRVEPKYAGRAERYIALEAGHAAQNLLLAATALGLAAVPLGSFSDAAVADALGLSAGEEVIYTIALGHPAGDAIDGP
jgi:SagB-type dehydrogenase family enzyme